MWWKYLTTFIIQRLLRWSSGMDKKLHPTHCDGCSSLSMLGLKNSTSISGSAVRLNWVYYLFSYIFQVLITLLLLCPHMIYNSGTSRVRKSDVSQIMENKPVHNKLTRMLPYRHGIKTQLLSPFRGLGRSPTDFCHKSPVMRWFGFFRWCWPEQAAKETVDLPISWDALMMPL